MRRFVEEPYPLTDMGTEDIVARAVDCFRSLPEVRAAFLIGSRVSGNIDRLSDVDFAVLLDDRFDHQTDLGIRTALISAFRTEDLGIVVLNYALDRVKASVASLGRLIYEREQGAAGDFLTRYRDEDYTPDRMEGERMEGYYDHLGDCIAELRDILSEGQEAAFGVRRNRFALERALQLAIQIVMDVSRHYVKNRGVGSPDDPAHAIEILGEHGVIPVDLARRLARAPGLRNRLVHEYVNVNREVLFRDLESGLSDFEEFLRTMRSR